MTEYATVESIRAAHALETHPSALSNAAKWSDALLTAVPATPLREAPEDNVALRITYLDGENNPDPAADYAMVIPFSEGVAHLAWALSLHEDIAGVAAYAIGPDGYPDSKPAYFYAYGEAFRPED